MLRIAIQSKGRLNEDSMALLSEAGIKVGTSKRTLLSAAKNFPLEILFLRDDDIPETVADGVADIGIVGLNELREKEAHVNIIRKLGFGSCRLSLAIPKDKTYEGPAWFNGKKIATSYPKILQSYLTEQGIQSEIHVITGSVEISPSIGLADAIFDIVSSGSTLISNNLKEVERVLESEAVLIGTPNLTADKQALLNELIFRIEAVQSAEDKKYVLMNAPKSQVQRILQVLPGIKSPTVMPLADNNWCSIHTVVDESRFWEIIGQLKANGAQGILVLPIEKMILL